MYIPYTKTKNIITKDHFQNAQSYMCTYPIQQHKHKEKGPFPKFPSLHMYITYTKTERKEIYPPQPHQ